MLKRPTNIIFTILVIIISTAGVSLYIYSVKSGRTLEKNGVRYYEKGFFREAAREFEAARRLRYSNIRLLGFQANSYLFTKQYKKSEETYMKILSYDKDNVWAMNQLAILYLATDKHIEALDILRKSLEINPEFTSSLILMGEVNIRLNNLTEADKYFEFAEKQQNNEVLTKVAQKGRRIAGAAKKSGFHSPTGWLQGKPVPETKGTESVFPIIFYMDKPRLAMISLRGQPVYYKLNESSEPKIFGIPIDVPTGERAIYFGIVESYEDVENYPVMALEYEAAKIHVEYGKSKLTEIWPAALAKVKDVDTIQFKLKTMGKLEESDILSGFKVFKFSGLKGFKKIKGRIDYNDKRNIITFKSNNMLASGIYLVYVSPKLKSGASDSALSGKIWTFSVIR